ncbi:MAG TPA: 30S ribosomal protein S7 [Candidatus Thermoplasmatota archaeon]
MADEEKPAQAPEEDAPAPEPSPKRPATEAPPTKDGASEEAPSHEPGMERPAPEAPPEPAPTPEEPAEPATTPEVPAEPAPAPEEPAEPAPAPAATKDETPPQEPPEEPAREVTPPPAPASPESIASAPSGLVEGDLTPEQRKGLVLLFGKWDFSEVTVRDPGLVRYINVRPIAVPHTSGRHANKSFAKQRLNIVERLINGMMRTEHSTGEKAHAYHVVEAAFDIVAQRTKRNPIQVFVDALQNTGLREEVTRLRFGGISVPKAVDVSPSRRLDVSLRNMCRGVIESSHRNKKRLPQCLADEIMNAAQGKAESAAMAKREEVERVAASAR